MLMLRMLEDPTVVLRDMTLENPIRAIREISHDITGRTRVRLANGREVSARHPRASTSTGPFGTPPDHELNPQEKQALAMWEHVMVGLEDDPMTLNTELDWVIKYQLVEAYRERHGLDPGDPGWPCSTCSTTTSTAPARCSTSCSAGASSSAWSTTTRSPRRSTWRPKTTRARLRGEFIRRAKERKRDYTVDWVHLKLNDQTQRSVLCKDPFLAHDERVEHLIDSL
jgi:proteasome accessory factor A